MKSVGMIFLPVVEAYTTKYANIPTQLLDFIIQQLALEYFGPVLLCYFIDSSGAILL